MAPGPNRLVPYPLGVPDAVDDHRSGADTRPPSVDVIARRLAAEQSAAAAAGTLRGEELPHPLLVLVAREAIAAGDVAHAGTRADALRRSLLQRVINATGVLLHTNLGRAPVGYHQPASYTNLELDLTTGARGSRSAHTATMLARACGAEAALVVNNGAAAVLLVLAALARGRGVAVSRGELVEIGGGFRVPEVMAESGAHLIEVGTTNRTRLADFERAVGDPAANVALVMQVHQSNYRIVGFTEAVTTHELAGLAVPLVVDIGSGLLDTACPWLADGPPAWLRDEPAVRQTLSAGAALVVCSGDKLLGGPQAGIVAGRAELVAACAQHPLARAFRPGSLVLGALHDTVMAYLRRDGIEVPFWRLATVPVGELDARAQAIVAAVGSPALAVVACASTPGGGTLPGVEIPSVGLALGGDHTAALRAAMPPIIARVHAGQTLLDLRTIDPADDPTVVAALTAAVVGQVSPAP